MFRLSLFDGLCCGQRCLPPSKGTNNENGSVGAGGGVGTCKTDELEGCELHDNGGVTGTDEADGGLWANVTSNPVGSSTV